MNARIKLHDEAIHNLYSSANVIQYVCFWYTKISKIFIDKCIIRLC
jgi:hypothetical protein